MKIVILMLMVTAQAGDILVNTGCVTLLNIRSKLEKVPKLHEIVIKVMENIDEQLNVTTPEEDELKCLMTTSDRNQHEITECENSMAKHGIFWTKRASNGVMRKFMSNVDQLTELKYAKALTCPETCEENREEEIELSNQTVINQEQTHKISIFDDELQSLKNKSMEIPEVRAFAQECLTQLTSAEFARIFISRKTPTIIFHFYNTITAINNIFEGLIRKIMNFEINSKQKTLPNILRSDFPEWTNALIDTTTNPECEYNVKLTKLNQKKALTYIDSIGAKLREILDFKHIIPAESMYKYITLAIAIITLSFSVTITITVMLLSIQAK